MERSIAGELILVASNCAVISVVGPLLSGALSSDHSPDFGMMTLLAEEIGAPVLQLVGDADFVVDEILFERIADMKRRTLILSGGLLESAVTQIAFAAFRMRLFCGGLRRFERRFFLEQLPA